MALFVENSALMEGAAPNIAALRRSDFERAWDVMTDDQKCRLIM